ncbi:hypothetical protein [Fischerella sp.]|jgi:hypothetical protein|uniref:hypothetical protein n=1 Tax=Fischerella sp. TaxID=1191 RepID=UPI0025C4DCC5|nr:hypothetical protein [Fischerella sp.]
MMMDLKNLKWTKNVTPQGNEWWAYSKFNAGYLFKLHWRDNKTNADKPQKDDLILLRQRGHVTHLVKVLDYKSEYDIWPGDFNIYRIVETIWAINWESPPTSAKANQVFGYDEVLRYESGDVMELKTLPTFQKYWNTNDGFDKFKNHVCTILNLS